jgi:hypothetical protein
LLFPPLNSPAFCSASNARSLDPTARWRLRKLVVADPEFRIEDDGSPRELDGGRVSRALKATCAESAWCTKRVG